MFAISQSGGWICKYVSDVATAKTGRKGLARDLRTSEIRFFLPSSAENLRGRDRRRRGLSAVGERDVKCKNLAGRRREKKERERVEKKAGSFRFQDRFFGFQGLFCSKGITMQSRDGIKK